jgi:tetratricopeptide (TPR) repeat protein
VLGESGGGKSALLANWVLRRREQQHPDEFLLIHFIGGTPYSADWAAMLRRILGEFKRRLGIEVEIPDAPDALRAAFKRALHATRGRIILVLDALNQLEDRDSAPDLVWLPQEIPANVRLLVSSLPGRPLDDLAKRGWPTLQVDPLRPDERELLIREYLAQYRKELSPDQHTRIAAAPQTANPLFLQALLEELRLFGSHERLEERIRHYLEAGTVPALYEKILSRYEEDYERDRPGLVRDAMTLLWAARQGLTEAELLNLLGEGGEPLPRATWSPLYLAAEKGLVIRSGLIAFFHNYLREAVRSRYMPDRSLERAAHLCLAVYFDSQGIGPRKIVELPWHLAETESWDWLYNLLCDLHFFTAVWGANEYEAKGYWAQLEANSSFRKTEGYRKVLHAPDQYPEFVGKIAAILADTGNPVEALALRDYLIEHFRRTGDKAKLQVSLGNKAVILRARGDLDGAMALHKEKERICRELGDKTNLHVALGNQAVILQGRGDLDAAMCLHKEKERICRELGDKANLQVALGNQGVILQTRGDLDGAMALHKEKERICRELGNRASLQVALGSQGMILKKRGDLDGAMALYKQEEQICRELGDKASLQVSLGNQAVILHNRGNLDGAMALHKEKERICRELGNKASLQVALNNQGMILRKRGDLDGAMALYREGERICRELGNKESLQISLGNQAAILKARGDLAGAAALQKERQRIRRELGLPNR